MISAPDHDAEFQKLFQAYAEQLPAKIGEIDALWAQAAAGDNVNAMQSLYRAFHSLAGSAGTFGHSELGRCAKALEKDFEALLDDVAPQPSGTLEPLAPLLQRLKRAAAAPEPRLAGPTTQPNPD